MSLYANISAVILRMAICRGSLSSQCAAAVAGKVFKTGGYSGRYLKIIVEYCNETQILIIYPPFLAYITYVLKQRLGMGKYLISMVLWPTLAIYMKTEKDIFIK